MLISNNMIKEYLSDYKNKDTKLSRYVKDGKFIKLKNGLYERNNI